MRGLCPSCFDLIDCATARVLVLHGPPAKAPDGSTRASNIDCGRTDALELSVTRGTSPCFLQVHPSKGAPLGMNHPSCLLLLGNLRVSRHAFSVSEWHVYGVHGVLAVLRVVGRALSGDSILMQTQISKAPCAACCRAEGRPQALLSRLMNPDPDT